MVDTKPWYLSRTIWASLVGILLTFGGFIGVNTGSIDPAGLTDALVQGAAALAALVAILGRLSATKQLR